MSKQAHYFLVDASDVAHNHTSLLILADDIADVNELFAARVAPKGLHLVSVSPWMFTEEEYNVFFEQGRVYE